MRENIFYRTLGLDHVQSFYKLIFQFDNPGIIFVEPFLVLGEGFKFFNRVDDLGADEDDDVIFCCAAVIFAK